MLQPVLVPRRSEANRGIDRLRFLFEDYALDTDLRELQRGAAIVSVTPQVFDLLDFLIRNRGRVVSKDDLIDAIWNGRSVSDAALATRLNATRSAIGDSGQEQRLVKTLPRKGFRFVGPVLEAQRPTDAPVADDQMGHQKPALALPDKPSIAVLPFQNLSDNPEQGAGGQQRRSSQSHLERAQRVRCGAGDTPQCRPECNRRFRG